MNTRRRLWIVFWLCAVLVSGVGLLIGESQHRSAGNPSPELQNGSYVEWPAPTLPGWTSPTIDRNEWRGIWSPSL